MKTLLAILLVLALGGGWWFWSHTHPAAVKYETEEVTRGDLTQFVTSTGSLNAVTNVTVGSQISGNVSKLFVDFNSPVEKDEQVAQIDPAPYLAFLHMAEANVANAKAALELARITATRKQELVKEHAAAQADMDTAVASLHQAEANLQIQQANQESAQVNLDHCDITSPIKGIVISRSVDVGQTVAAAMNAPVLFTVANDLSKMQIDASVAEADVGQLETGQDVNFTVDAYPYRTFQGKVSQVRNAPSTVQNVVTYDTIISVKNDDLKLKPGMTANISIVIARRGNVLKIPNAALRFRPPDEARKTAGTPAPMAGPAPSPHARHDTSRSVYVIAAADGKPSPVPVHLGISDGITTEALDGLHEGDELVIGLASPEAPAGGSSRPMGGMRRPF